MNYKKLSFVLSLIVTFISRIGYFIFEAKFVEGNGFNSIYHSFSLLIASSDFLLSIWQMPEILQSIKIYDEFIEKSKSITHTQNTHTYT